MFFLALFLFFFVVWFVSGGPTRPISFAGPYITPITDVDQTQQGYGATSTWLGGIPDVISNGFSGAFSQTEIRGRLMTAEDELRRLEDLKRDVDAFGDPSPYKDQVSITSVSAGTSAKDEYVTIQVSGSAPGPISITGWRLKSVASGKSDTIERGTELPRAGVNETGNIVLQPGDQATIATGDSPIGVSFRENMCVGYFSERQTFVPNLWSSCPTATSEFERYYEGNQLRDDKCYSYVQSLPTCRSASNPPANLTYACTSFLDEYLDYRGCVDAHRTESRFKQNRYRVYLERGEKLWKSSREAIRLLDQNGKTVDLYTY